MSLLSLSTDCCVLATTCYTSPAAGGCLNPFWQVPPAAVAGEWRVLSVPGTCNAAPALLGWRAQLVMSHHLGGRD